MISYGVIESFRFNGTPAPFNEFICFIIILFDEIKGIIQFTNSLK